ncbi:MAG: tetratricopeptide repeat protein [Betaproteobacteria bacterium]|nr:tetratricopeptide repeat protein [Betaproteobacteria bacterium]
MDNIKTLDTAVNDILSACREAKENGDQSPFFFMIGAGVSSPQIPASAEVIEHCRKKVADGGSDKKSAMDEYSFWLDKAYPQPKQRTGYLRKLIENRKISQANFRLAHLLLGEDEGKSAPVNVVVTPNFDDHLSRALTLFGKRHIVCDHPATTQRITLTDRKELYLIHVHGSYHFYECKNLAGEIEQAAQGSARTTGTMASLLDAVLRERSPLVVGYSGWEQDVFMQALKRRLQEPLPYNLYWFCYRRGAKDALPYWLKEHHNVRFILPEEREKRIFSPVEKTKYDKGLFGDRIAFSKEQPVEVSGLGEPTLDARIVFDAMIRGLDLEAPKLTRDPLQSLIDRLHETFPAEDMEEDDDLYSLKSVVERIRSSSECLESVTGAVKADPLEPMRDAMRRSDYQGALQYANEILLEAISPVAMEELVFAAFEVARGLSFDSGKDDCRTMALQAVDLVMDVYSRLKTAVVLPEKNQLDALVAKTLLLKGLVLDEMGSYELSIRVFDELIGRFGSIEGVDTQYCSALALAIKGDTFGQLARKEEAIAAYDEMVKRYGDAPEEVIRERVAVVLMNKGIALGQLDRGEEAIAVYDEVVKRYGDAPEAALREQVAEALVNKGVTLGQLERGEEAIAVYDEVVKRYGDAPEAALQEQVAIALRNKGVMLGQLDCGDKEIAIYDEVVKRYGGALEAALREEVAIALRYKGVTLGQLDRGEEAIAVYDEVVKRYGDAPEAALQEQVAIALRNKGVKLGQLDRGEEAIAVYDEVVKRYGDTPEAALREEVAIALRNKGVRLCQLDRGEEAIAVYDEVVKRYGDAPEAALREEVAIALNGWGFGLLCEAKKVWRGGDEATAIGTLKQALKKIEAAQQREPNESIYLGNQGYILFLLGRVEEARPILTKAIALGGEELRQIELNDADIHPLPQDKAFKALIESL